MNKKVILYSIFFLLLTLVAAAQEEFAVTAQDKVELCPCSNQAYPVYVQNYGASTSEYIVSFSGNAAEWVKASTSKFKVSPGVASYFFVYVNSDCDTKGNYDLNIHVTTGSLMKTVKQSLNFIECYKFDIEQGDLIGIKEGQESVSFSKHDGAYNICEEEEKVLPILVTNKESYGNSYSLILKGEEWTKLNVGKVALDGNARGIVLVDLKPGEMATGNYKFNFDVVTELGNVKQSREIDVNVKKCYGLKIELEKEEELVCGEAVYDVKLENDGVFSEEVELSTNLEWAEIGNETLILSGEEEKTVQLALKPDVSGNFDIEVSGLVTNKPDIIASDKINVNAATKEDCYKTEVGEKRIVNYYSEEYYNIDVLNSGLKKSLYNVSMEGPSWTSISPGSLELSPGQKGNLNLYAAPGEEIEAGDHKIVLKLDSNDVVYSEEIDVRLIKESEIVKNVKSFVIYFQYYVYLIVLIGILIFIFIRPIKKQIRKARKRYSRYKLKKERARQRRKERKEKEEQRKKEEEKRKAEKGRKKQEEEERKAREEKKKKEDEKRKKELEEKKITEEKKAEKTTKKKKRKTKNLAWLWFLLILIIAGVIFLSVYFEWIDYTALFSKADLSAFSFISAALKSAWAYSYYILIALVFLVLSIMFFNTLEKEGKVKKEKKKRKKKIEISKIFKSVYFNVSLAVLALLIIGIVIYLYFFEQAKEFFTLYLPYIIAGLIILILLILFMKFYKPIIDFLTEEER